MKRKNVLIMVICILVVAFFYFFSSGFFVINSSLGDVFSTKEGNIISEDQGEWCFVQPEEENLTSYFVYNGEKNPMKTVALRCVYFIDNNGTTEEKTWDVFLVRDKHFFIGESRWYLPESSEKVEAAYCKIAYREHPSGKVYYDYLYSDNLSKKQIAAAKKWTDSVDMDTNMINK